MKLLVQNRKEQRLISSASVKNELQIFVGEDNYSYEHDIHIIRIGLDNMFSQFQKLRDDFEFIVLLDICGVDNSNLQVKPTKRFEVVYHLLQMEKHQRLRVKIAVDEEESISSICKLWETANWYETELTEMFGLKMIAGHNSHLLLHKQFLGFPLRKDFQPQNNLCTQNQEISFARDYELTEQEKLTRNIVKLGPIHPILRGHLKLLLELDDTVIKRSGVEIGYQHRGIEKTVERKGYNQIIPYVNRLNSNYAFMNEFGWCKTVEDLMGINISDRYKALRMALAELSRINSHMTFMANIAHDIGAASVYFRSREQGEKIFELFEKICGARVNPSLLRIGGMAYDVSSVWITDCLEILNEIEREIICTKKELISSRIWLDNTRIGKISVKQAVEWGYSGPSLRASGVNYDLRKSTPYYFYDQVDFETPIGIDGTCYDRCLVRIEEILQSIKILSQILNNVPVQSPEDCRPNITLPSKKDLYSDDQALLKHYELMEQGISPIAGEIYSATETAEGELGFYLVSDGANTPYRLKIRSPGFPVCQFFNQVIENSILADALITFSSLNIDSCEVDR